MELSDSWHQCYNTLLGNCGRERKTTSQADRQLIRNSKINIRLLAEDLKREMNKMNSMLVLLKEGCQKMDEWLIYIREKAASFCFKDEETLALC